MTEPTQGSLTARVSGSRLILGLFSVLFCGTAIAGQPNILFILTDDHALEAIGAYDSWLKDYVETPTIDRLAAEGIRFNNLASNNSICSPSRASILTGQYSHRNGVRNNNGNINADSPVVSEELLNAGYQTAVYGKWHLESQPRGYDDYAITKRQGKYNDPTFSTPRGEEKHEGYYADVYTDKALDWLRNRDPSKPFALSVHYKGPHHPYDYPERWDHLLDGVEVPEPPTLHEDAGQTSPRLKALLSQQMSRTDRSYYDRHVNDRNPVMPPAGDDLESRASAAYQHMIHKYIRTVAAIDENIERLLDRLETEGILDDTIVIYSSDQGYWLGQHGLYDKRLILEESLKMPLIVRFPREIEAGSISNHLSSNVDLAPTLLDYAGVDIPESMQGRSMRPLFKGASPKDWRTAIWYAYWAKPAHWGIRSERYTLVLFPGTDEFEFYDLQKDPLQRRSLHADPDYADAIAESRQLLEQTMVDVDIEPSDLPR
jgi:arylsulfatase A-like enzyme